MTHRFSSRLLDATLSIPPIRPQNILPVVIMLIIWIAMRQAAVAENTAFVVSVVVAQAYAVWRNLPQAAASIGQVQEGKPRLLRWPVIALLVFSALQLLLADPLFTQRLLSASALFFLVIMVLGIMREGDLLERVTPRASDGTMAYKTVSLLRINALVAAMVIAVNEILISSESPAIWITVMPLFFLFLHGLYWFLVLMVLPMDDSAPRTGSPVSGG